MKSVQIQLIRRFLLVGGCEQECFCQASNRSTTGAYYRHIYLAESLFHLKFGRQVSLSWLLKRVPSERNTNPVICLECCCCCLNVTRSIRMSGLILSRSLSLTLAGTFLELLKFGGKKGGYFLCTS